MQQSGAVLSGDRSVPAVARSFLLTDKTEKATLKATDFGLSVFFKDGQQFRDIVGSAYYVAPEVSARLSSAQSSSSSSSSSAVGATPPTRLLLACTAPAHTAWGCARVPHACLQAFSCSTQQSKHPAPVTARCVSQRCVYACVAPACVPTQVLRRKYGKEADIWSCGVMLYILLSGMPPFYGDNEQQIFDAILRNKVDFESDPWPKVSEPAKVRRGAARSASGFAATVLLGWEHVAPSMARGEILTAGTLELS